MEAAFQAHYEAKWPDANFELLDACGAIDPDRAEFFTAYIKQQQAPEEALTPRVEIDAEDEERRRAGRGGGDMGNPAHLELGANMRPDVVSGPAGLETVTTQKSVQYHVDDDASDYLRARLAEAQRSDNQPTLTLEAIREDSWNAVELPLPSNADKELLTAARDAADHHVELEHHLMMEARAGRNTEHWSAEFHAAGEPQPDAHEFNEGRWLQALTRFELIEDELGKFEGRASQGGAVEPARDYIADRLAEAEQDEALTPDQARQHENTEESLVQQNTEKPARADEEGPLREVDSPAADYIADRLREAKEAKAQEPVTQDHDAGRTPGGGRGMF